MSNQAEPGQTAPKRTTPSPPKASRRRRLATRLGIGAGALLVLFVLVVFVLPTPLARYVIESQLEDLGIQHDGIDTVDIDLWNSEVRAGPVTFRSGEAQDGQIGETGFDYSFGELFEGHAFVQTFYLRGVDIYVARLENGAIEINGINLQDLAASDAESAAPEEEEEEGAGFGYGGESFEFSDSRLVFEDLSGGTLTMELDRLTLERLRSWTPEEPTSFTFEGRLNEIEISLDGTIVPLGDPLEFTLNSRTKGITLDRVARFIGPTGLARQSGSVDSEVSYDYEIHRDGRVAGTVDGSYRFNGFDVATETGETVSLDEAILKVDLIQELRPDGSASARGQLNLTGGRLLFSNQPGDALEVGALEFTLDSLDLEKGAEKRERLWQAVEAAEASASEAAPSIVELLIGWARKLGQDALLHHLSLDAQPAVTLQEVLLRTAARDGQPSQELRFDEASLRLGDVASEAFNAGWRAKGALDTVISGLRVALQDGSAEATLAALRVDSQAIDFNVTRQETKLVFDLAVGLEKLAAKDGRGGALDLSRLSLATDGFEIGETAEREDASGPVALGLEGLAATLTGEDGDLALRGESLALNLSPLTLAGKQGEAGRVTGSLELKGLSLERDGETPLTFSLAETRSELQDISVAPLDAQAVVEGGLATSLSGIALTAGKDTEAVSLSLETLENQVTGLRAAGFDSETPSVTLANETGLSGLTARLPLPGGESVEATVASLQAPLSELGYSEGNVLAKGAVEVSGIAARTGGEAAQTLDLASLSIAGLDGDSAQGVAVERIALGRLDAKLALPLPGRAAAATTETADATPAPAETGTQPEAGTEPAATESGAAGPPRFDRQFKLGEFTLAPGSTVEITDRSVEPPLQASVTLEELKAGPIDTAAPETHTDLALALSVNEASKIRLQGWAAPLKAKPDFELTSDVEGLALPVLSSYAAKATGMNIESGDLFAGITAKSAAGDLDGAIDLKIDDLFVTPLDDEQAEKLKADIGLPVGFAVSILKDSEGVIAFNLPLGGTVEAPEVDYSEAVDKAISGAMASVFPTNWFGPDGNTFEMQPAPFAPGTAELTAAGMEVADQMGDIFANKPGISIRACGRAGRADLVALRGGDPEDLPELSDDTVVPAGAPADRDSSEAEVPAEAVAALQPPDKGIAPAMDVAAPSDQEVEALLGLATERGTAVRKYLEAKYGIAPDQIPECRTAYSIEDGKPPRAEFQF